MTSKTWHNVSESMDDGSQVKDWLLERLEAFVSLEALFSSGER